MQAIQNKASIWIFVYLFILTFGLCTVANARTSTSQQVSSAKKTSAAKHKKATAKKVVQKSKIVTRRSLRSATGRTTQKHGATSKIQVGLRERQLEDIIVHRPKSGFDNPSIAQLRSEAAFVLDLKTSTILYDKNSDEVRPIASISKLMTALIVAESGLSMSDPITISEDDVDRLRHSRSRLVVGTRLSRAEMLHLALMSSENRAAHALARYYPGGMPAFVRAMNDKARSLGMRHTHFIEPTGLSAENVSTARDLVKLLRAVSKQALIHRYTTDDTEEITLNNGRRLTYNNSNQLVKNAGWDIQISKTGFINEAGECLVMVTRIDGRDVAMVLLNSTGRYSRIGDAVRMRSYVERGTNLAML